MKDFTIIYKILKFLHKMMDFSEPDFTPIFPEQLGITETRWEQLMIMLQKNGYIEGLRIYSFLDSPGEHIYKPLSPKITLQGLEYLSENSVMKKAANAAKGIIDAMT